MFYFEDVIHEIEADLTQKVDIGALSRKAGMSIYEFRRIFSFVAKIPLNEYIRKRRLSVAAVELYEGKRTVTEAAIAYGYDSPSSFTRAFREFHGVTPTEVVNRTAAFKLLTRISAQITTSGGKDIAYTLLEKPAFTVSGYRGVSPLADTECCEAVWEAFYDTPFAATVTEGEIYAVYNNREDTVECCIGVEGPTAGASDAVEIPASKWACFSMRGTEDATVNAFYSDILRQWLASVEYERNNALPNVEIYPADMSGEDFTWQILIPIKERSHR